MRAAYVCADPGVPVFGHKGNSVHVQEVIRALLRRGARVTLFARRLGGEVPPGLEAVDVQPLPPVSGKAGRAREHALFAGNRALRRALEAAGPFDLVYERYSLFSQAGMGYARLHDIPGLLEVNAPLIEEQRRHRGLHDELLADQVAAQVFAEASALLAVSEEVGAYLRGVLRLQAPGWPVEHRVHVVPNGVDPGRFPDGLPPARPGPPGSFTVGFVGTLKPWHGLPVLVDAFARLHARRPGVRLLVVGDGPEREALRAELSGRGLLDAAELCGAVEPARIPGLLASMDVAVAPYPALEPFYFSPLKVMEYLAAGRAVVASRIGQLPELLDGGRCGLLVAPGDAGELAQALDDLACDPCWRARLGQAARQRALRHLTWDAVAGRVLALAGRQGTPPVLSGTGQGAPR